MWKKLTEDIKLLVTVISIIVTLSGAIGTGYVWYNSVSEVIDDYPKLQKEVENLKGKISTSDTINSPYLTKTQFKNYVNDCDADLIDLYKYKYPYGKWAQKGIDF